MPPSDSFYEEWEDVADDNLSVISLPVSEPTAESSSDSESAVECSSDPNLLSHIVAKLAIDKEASSVGPAWGGLPRTPVLRRSASTDSFVEANLPPPPSSKYLAPFPISDGINQTNLRGRDEVSVESNDASGLFSGATTAEAGKQVLEDPFRDPSASSRDIEAQVAEDPAGENSDDEDEDITPVSTFTQLESLGKLLDETYKFAQGLPADDHSYGIRIAQCSQNFTYGLVLQIGEIRPIVRAYKDAYTSDREVPLDPNLYGWIEGVRSKIVGLHAELQHLARQKNPWDAQNIVLNKTLLDLKQYWMQMKDFLPIMQADFGDFQTEGMNLPTAPAHDTLIDDGAAYDEPSRSRNAPSLDPPYPVRPSETMWILRRELYRLKDEIQRAIEKLSDANGFPSEYYTADLICDLIKLYGKVFNNIGLLLSNHGTDWVESALSGGLTFAEFSQIDADCVRDFTAQLAATVDGVNDRRDCWQALREAAARRCSVIALERGQLDKLRVLADLLNETLNPDRG
ncbi:hypothetical protein QBC46DRAFT_137063 [Diplogelasinospora grovesii]|uniref:Uncharacterized protein n=1 Tax=Diplogelasinospora grovesii TaxID=303347 RepID=A0AAN6S4A2_9PEZI|nr:hypothetical protein QBC46DRAFT_137063 [Diplogelasinospora grovesii]